MPKPRQLPQLTPGVIHVYSVPVPPPERIAQLERELPNDERSRAGRFLAVSAKGHFVAGRIALRELLSRYLDRPAAALVFEVDKRGKPKLGAAPSTTLRFNLSHSGALAVHAFALSREVGVDIQEHRPIRDLHDLAASVCAPAELELLESTGPAKLATFYRCWARKEAVLKASGHGLGLPLRALDVLSEPGTLLQRAPVPELDGAPWHVLDLPARPGYSAAVAVQGGLPKLASYEWSLKEPDATR